MIVVVEEEYIEPRLILTSLERRIRCPRNLLSVKNFVAILLLLLGITFGTVSHSLTFAQDEPEVPTLIGGGSGGSSGGGGGPVVCPNPEISVGNCTCRSDGCRLAPGYSGTYVCNYGKVAHVHRQIAVRPLINMNREQPSRIS